MQKINNIVTCIMTNYKSNLLDSLHLNKQSEYSYDSTKEHSGHDRITYKYNYIM